MLEFLPTFNSQIRNHVCGILIKPFDIEFLQSKSNRLQTKNETFLRRRWKGNRKLLPRVDKIKFSTVFCGLGPDSPLRSIDFDRIVFIQSGNHTFSSISMIYSEMFTFPSVVLISFYRSTRKWLSNEIKKN